MKKPLLTQWVFITSNLSLFRIVGSITTREKREKLHARRERSLDRSAIPAPAGALPLMGKVASGVSRKPDDG